MTASPETIAALKQRLRDPLVIDGKEYWLAEGDLLLDEEQLARYADGGQANVPPPPVPRRDELLSAARGGLMLRWRPGTVLSYTIRKAEFPKAGQYDTLRADLMQATKDWEDTCGVKFEHRRDLDDGDGAGALFTVRAHDTGGRYLALAFFPDWTPERRKMLIDPKYFAITGFPREGVLRHELGHVLGFRHEHIRPDAPPICGRELGQGEVIDLSKYDPKSVMHYFCGGMGSPKLEITEVDVLAAQRLYGPPLHKLEYCD